MRIGMKVRVGGSRFGPPVCQVAESGLILLPSHSGLARHMNPGSEAAMDGSFFVGGAASALISNARIFDGSGRASFPGELIVRGDRIVAVGRPGSLELDSGLREMDMGGAAVAPGFIDAHTHDDRIVLDNPAMVPKVSQGVTTVVVGNCGISLVPVLFDCDPPPPMNLLGGREAYEFPTMKSYAERLASAKPSVNVVALIGHSALRLAAMGDISRRATDSEADAMRRLARECMENGASGFSTGLFYPTNEAADADEVVAVAQEFSGAGGVYATHMRDESAAVMSSINESAETSSRARIPLVISHHKCAGVDNWGRTAETVRFLERLSRDIPVNFDVYPYTAGSTNLREDLVTDRIRIMVTWSRAHPEERGRDLADIADDWGVSLLDAARRLQPAGAIYFQMREDDVQRVMKSELSMIGSDGLPHDEHPHPRLWGTFPRVIGKYARELELFPMETAIRKMTGLTAEVFGLSDRGRIAPGCAADLVVFDPDRIRDTATYDDPKRRAEGIVSVMVNGSLVLENGEATGAGTGRLLTGRRSWSRRRN